MNLILSENEGQLNTQHRHKIHLRLKREDNGRRIKR